jgi:hypothetical protein
MRTEGMSAGQAMTITAFVDIQAPPPSGLPTAHVIFGTNQFKPAGLAVERYHRGLAPLIIVTGGVNRHSGIVEGQEFRRFLAGRGVPDEAIRVEDKSASTWQNVEFALPHLSEALESGLALTAISKWYHRRAVHSLKTLVPGIGSFYALAWEPVYEGRLVTRTDWPLIPGGSRRVVREWEEVTRRVADGSFKDAHLANGAWH